MMLTMQTATRERVVHALQQLTETFLVVLQVQQLYDEASIKAVLAEWFRSIGDLPAIIRQSVQLGLFSSAQLVRFLAMDVRPNVTRSVTRVLPPRVRLLHRKSC